MRQSVALFVIRICVAHVAHSAFQMASNLSEHSKKIKYEFWLCLSWSARIACNKALKGYALKIDILGSP